MNIVKTQTNIEGNQSEDYREGQQAERHGGLLSLLALPLLAVNRALSGPPTTERERIRAALAESKIRYTSGPFR